MKVDRRLNVHEHIAVECLAPADVDVASARAFKRVVRRAGEVNPHTLSRLLKRVLILGFARFDNRLVGVGAIKRPYSSYRNDVFEKARSTRDPKAFAFELGWFHVLNEFTGNGIASQLVRNLMPYAKHASIYATSNVENVAMHRVMTRYGGFAVEGSEYPSAENDIPLNLYVRIG